MAKYMLDLPGPPLFPVYGLDAEFDGYRWLVVWNDQRQLYTVTLGHGAPESGPWITITTYLKTPIKRIDDHRSSGPTGFGDAQFEALAGLDEHARPDGMRAGEWLTQELNRPGYTADLTVLGPEDLAPEWEEIEISIDTKPHRAHRREIGSWAAILVDLPGLALSIDGPQAAVTATLRLADATAMLHDYV